MSAKPQRVSSHFNRRAIPDDAHGDDDVIDSSATAPFAPGTSRDSGLNGYDASQAVASWTGNDGEEPEDNMAAPNFHTSKISWNKKSYRKSEMTRDFDVSGPAARMGPHHQKLYAVKPSDYTKKHRRRSSPTSKEESGPQSKIAGNSASLVKSKVQMKVKSVKKEKPEMLPTPLPAAGFKPTHANGTSKVKTVTLRKRSESKATQEENRKLINELGAILKDDDKEAVKRIPPDVKRETHAQDDKDQDETKTVAQGRPKTDRKAFDEWLRNEYFRNMALSLSTAKKKRNTPVNFGAPDLRRKRKVDFEFEEPDFDSEQGGEDEYVEVVQPISDTTADENVKTVLPADFDPETVQRRLQMLENAVLTEAVEKIVERARDSAMAEAAREQVAQRLAEAFYLEKLQQALEDKMSTPSVVAPRSKKLPRISYQNPNDDDDDDGDNVQWRNVGQESEEQDDEELNKRNGNLAEALSGMSQSDKRRPDIANNCPELRLLMSDCSSLEEILPPDTGVSPELRHTCNKHEVCYTCGEAFGLTASVCDVQFLRETAELCNAEGEKCEPHDLTKILAPLRERRVFYKRSIPPVCYRAHACIGRFLAEP